MRRRSNSRSRSRTRATSESRQPEDEGRRRSTAHQFGGPANTSNVVNANGGGCAPMQVSTPPRNTQHSRSSSGQAAYPTTPDTHHTNHLTAPHSCPQFPRARCYRLNLEKPFDITKCVSPLGKNAGFSSRDYSGPIREADLPPVQGPVEYQPPPHLAAPSVGDMMANLQVSRSEESMSEVAIAITTAEIFRGITVDHKTGLITGMNSRATRSRKDKGKNMQGEKSRQAAKIDKAKDLIDEVVEGGGGDAMMGNDENDPSKILSLFIMGEYEELNDLVRDGSKKLRDYKSQPDEVLVQMNRPRPSDYDQNQSSSNSRLNFPTSPINSHGSSLTSFSSRKRGFSKERVRQKFNILPKSAPPKIKPHSRDGPSKRQVGGGASVTSGNTSHTPTQYYSSPRQSSYHAHPGNNNNWGMDVDDQTDANFAHCNIKSDWHDIFFHNSLWNCGNVNAATSSTPNQSPRNQGYNYGGDNQSYNGSQYSAYGAGAGAYHSRNGYEEGRNPSGGYGYTRGHSSSGVRDSTVVM